MKCQGRLVSNMASCKTNINTYLLGIILCCLSPSLSETRLNRDELVRRNEILKDTVERLEHVVDTLERKLKRNVIRGDNTERKFKVKLSMHTHAVTFTF